MADEEEIKVPSTILDGDGEEGEETEPEETEEVEEVPEEEEEEVVGKTEEEILREELAELGIPSEEELLENYPFPIIRDPSSDDSGRDAYCAKTKEFDFFMFPIDSVTTLFDLQVLNLRHCGLGDKGAIALAECLKVNQNITELSLVDNWITAKGGDALLEAIRHNTLITKVDISENRLGYRAGQLGQEVELGDLLHKLLRNDTRCKQLKTLSLRANHIGDRDMEKICDALSTNTWLHNIDVSYNELGPASGKALGAMIAANMDIRSIDLQWNQLRGLGTFSVINDGMMDNNTLRRISIAWNGAEDKVGEAFGQALSKNGSLEEVDLSHNRIGEKGAVKIAEGLLQNQSLRRLNLSFNPLGDNGCKAILTAIRDTQNTQLCYVDIKSSDAGEKAHEELQLTKQQKPSVEIAVPRSLMVPDDMLAEPE